MSDHFWILSMKGLRPKHFRNFEICGDEIKWYFHVKITDNISSFYQFGIYWVLFSLFSEICDFFLNSGFELQFNLKKFVTNVLFFRSISKWFEKKTQTQPPFQKAHYKNHMPLVPFYTPWKHRKTRGFQGV